MVLRVLVSWWLFLLSASEPVPVDGLTPEARDRLEAFIASEMEDKTLPAFSIALVDDQETIYARAFGEADTASVYRFASLSKLFNALALTHVAEQGHLDLDAPLSTYLPDFAFDNPFDEAVTPRMLLSHRSGAQREPSVGHYFDFSEPTLEATARSLDGTRLIYEPGTRTKYSNAAVALSGYVLQTVVGRPYAAYVRENLLEPMGLHDTTFEPRPDLRARLVPGVMWTTFGRTFDAPVYELGILPAANLYSTVEDLGRFLSVLFADGNGLIEPETLEQMWTPQFTDAQTGYGLGFHVSEFEGRRRVGHSGMMYGHASRLYALPDDKLGVVAVANVDAVNAVVDRVAAYALSLMLAVREDRPLPPLPQPVRLDLPVAEPLAERPSPPPSELTGLIGEYGWPHNTLYVFERQGTLHALIEWFFEYPLTHVDADTYRFPDTGLYMGEALTFTRDGSGRATRVRAAGIDWDRRPVGTEDGSTFTITPLHPYDSLRTWALAAEPPDEAGAFLEPDLVELTALDSTIRLDVRYAGTNNFMQAVFYDEPRVFLQRPAAEALVRVHQALRQQGFGLWVFDGYRPWYVTKMFWDATPGRFKGFVANPDQGSRHNRGCAVDLTLYDLATGRPVDMVSGYDEFSDRAYPTYPAPTDRRRWHRDVLRNAMEAEGFTVIPNEWWHFDFHQWRQYPITNLHFDEVE